MNLSQIVEEVNKDIDDTLSSSEIKGWINRGLDDLSLYAKYQKSESIQLLTDQTKYLLPSDMIEIVHVLDEAEDRSLQLIPMKDFLSKGYKVWGNELILQPKPKEEKELTLYFHARLPHLIDSNDIPELPEHFHDLLVLYAVARAKYQDEEESMQQNAMQEYFMRKEQFIAFIKTLETHEIQEVSW